MAVSSREARRFGGGGFGIGRLVARLRLAALALVVFAAACSAVYRNHGYVPVEEDLAQIEVGVDTRETVAEKIGRPSAQGLLNDVGWFYVQSRFKHYGPKEPEEIDRQVLAVTFTEAGVVENIGRYGLEDGRMIEISRRVTETNVKGVGFIRQLLSNFGRIQLSDLAGD
ncbi:outer membrane protein assembly factor BamE [Rhodobacter sp. Har01]|uniref:outer membrane protein assembly factor BamE n=1 Tax=Rhodobacter sp. Har01 TaxID=2883999 RepID=UPI001D072CF3|nr:outer membrane protein assembly factor BamE [Rhodobacter sp. Har01]MCB6177035.1 outer membrane protein assembly factor BamE [Rhodobacter sp. Har01]